MIDQGYITHCITFLHNVASEIMLNVRLIVLLAVTEWHVQSLLIDLSPELYVTHAISTISRYRKKSIYFGICCADGYNIVLEYSEAI